MIRYDVNGEVAVITVDNPPVNALEPGALQAIEQAVARAVSDPAVAAIVVAGAGATFAAGADINMFRTLKTREQSLGRSEAAQSCLSHIEDAGKPIVAALQGHALGGGLELAMACHARVATGDAEVGQPEVLLGLIPGAGGTQRLPRLCGVMMALDLCTEGKPISAALAQAGGIIDEVIDGDRQALMEKAVATSRRLAATGSIRKTRELSEKLTDLAAALQACDERRTALAGTKNPVTGPYAAVDAIEAAVMLAFDAGLLVERELFTECVLTSQSRALVHLFLAERDVRKVPGVPADTPARDIRRAAVVGAGTMGGGIAMACANAGIPVLLKEVDEAALDRGLATIRRSYESSVARGTLGAGAMSQRMARITPTTTFSGFDEVDLVVEAVFEDLDLKRTILAELGRVTRPDAVLASTTSALDIDELARASGRPGQVVGHHFFSPAHVMKLVEIVRARDTVPATIATSLKLARRLGKIGVVVGNCFGFVANRMLACYLREAYLMLEEGACVQQIDRALAAFGMPVGPFAMEDTAGIDVGARIRRHRRAAGNTRAEGPQSELPDRLYGLGRYGQRTGAGWYRYQAGSRTPVPDPLVEQLADEAAGRRGVTRRVIADQEIVARATSTLVNEGARVLEEGFATRPGDIDVISCHGFGFPRYRGGPMFYADTIGVATVLSHIRAYRDRSGDHSRPAALIERLVHEGRGFYE